jgi:hypothetical protein
MGRTMDDQGSPPPERLAVTALGLAAVSLLVPLVPAIVALALAAMAARRIRQAPEGMVAGRGLVTATFALSAIGLLAWAGLGTLAFTTHQQEPANWRAATVGRPIGSDRFSEVTAPPATEPPATEPTTTAPATTQPKAITAPPNATTAPPKAAVGRVGDRVTLYDEFGAARLEITVTQVKFWAGDQYEQPEHGLFMGAYVSVHALADLQETPWADSYALVAGHRYRGDVLSPMAQFDPLLDPVPLDTGEEASGWLVFDVPTRHGQLVLRGVVDQRDFGTWKY